MHGWTIEPCGNTDSCTEDDTHAYPVEGIMVRVPEEVGLREVGSSRTVLVPPGEYKVLNVLHVSHEAALDVDGTTVWADVEDDIEEIV